MPKFKFPKYTIARTASIDEDQYPEIAGAIAKYHDAQCDIHGNKSMVLNSETLSYYIEEGESRELKNDSEDKKIMKQVLDAMELQNIDQLHIYKG